MNVKMFNTINVMDNNKPSYKVFRKKVKSGKEAFNCEKYWIAKCLRENMTDEIADKLSITQLRNWYKKLFKVINNN